MKHTLPTDSAARKDIPITTGVLDYFPRALAAVAKVSLIGNEKHNPGQPLHWAKHKSQDHADCIGRHLLERGTFDKNGVRHSAQLAWRALALLEEEIARFEGTWGAEVLASQHRDIKAEDEVEWGYVPKGSTACTFEIAPVEQKAKDVPEGDTPFKFIKGPEVHTE